MAIGHIRRDSMNSGLNQIDESLANLDTFGVSRMASTKACLS